MATSNDLDQPLTLFNVAQRAGADKNITRFVNLLAQNNPFMMDVPSFPTSHDVTHSFDYTKRLGASFVKRHNKGVGVIKHDFGRVTEPTAAREVYMEIPISLDKEFDMAAEKARQSDATVAAMGNELFSIMLYANQATDPDTINGIMTRKNKISVSGEGRFKSVRGTTNPSGGVYYDLIIAQPGPGNFYFTYPKRTQWGVEVQEIGETVDKDSNGLRQQVDLTKFAMSFGIAIEHPASIQRICNIVAGAAAGAGGWTPQLMNDAISYLPNRGAGAVIYAPRDIWLDMLNSQVSAQSIYHEDSDPWGKPQWTYLGIPVRICDGMLPYSTLVT